VEPHVEPHVEPLLAGLARAWRSLDLVDRGEDTVPLTTLPLSIFAASALLCLSASTAFHLLHVMNRRVYEVLARADYTGIAVLIAGSMVPPVVYGFWCTPAVAAVYLACTFLASGATVVLGMLDAFRTPEWRTWRAGAFTLAGASGVLPLLHISLFTPALSHPALATAMGWLAAMAGQYVAGAFIYAMRVPERWSPGSFDLFFQSHTLFHLLVVGAALAHWRACAVWYVWRAQHACSAELW
jgi:adiponectin receptor